MGYVGQGRRSKVKVKCQNHVFHVCYLALRSRSKVKVKVKDHDQMSNYWHAAVDKRASVLPSAVKSIKSEYHMSVYL